MLTVYKYPLTYGEKVLVLPTGAKPLSIGEVGEDLIMWALVDTDAPKTHRTFLVAQTGDAIARDPQKLTHIGTVVKGWWVGHVFEATE